MGTNGPVANEDLHKGGMLRRETVRYLTIQRLCWPPCRPDKRECSVYPHMASGPSRSKRSLADGERFYVIACTLLHEICSYHSYMWTMCLGASGAQLLDPFHGGMGVLLGIQTET